MHTPRHLIKGLQQWQNFFGFLHRFFVCNKMNFKIPRSVLVVIHTQTLEVLLIKRLDGMGWQSVTGSLASEIETAQQAAVREVWEETGIEALAVDHQLIDLGIVHKFPIFPSYLHRYSPGTTHNLEHVFRLEVPRPLEIRLSPHEHSDGAWLPLAQAIEQVFSETNRTILRNLAS